MDLVADRGGGNDPSANYVFGAIGDQFSVGTPLRYRRRFIICVIPRADSGDGEISNVQIAGSVGTQNLTQIVSSRGVGIYITPTICPTGTTAYVTVKVPKDHMSCGIDIYSVYNLRSITPIATNSTTSDNTTMTLTAERDGICFGASGVAYFGGSSACTITYLTEYSDRNIHSGRLAGATGALITSTSSATPKFDWSNTGLGLASVAATFR